MNALQIKQIRLGLLAECDAILDVAESEGRELTVTEKAKYDAAVARVEKLNAELDAAQPVFHGGQHRPSFQGYQPSNALPNDNTDESQFGRNIALPTYSGISLRAFKNTPKGREDAYAAGKWLQATLLQDPKAARWCQEHGLAPDVMAASSTSPNTAGGALVPDILSNRIIDLREEYGLFRQQADVVPMSSMTETFPVRAGGLTASFTGEGAEIDESDLLWSNISLTARKLGCLSRMSSELSDDAIVSVADRFTMEIAYAFAVKEDGVGFNGTGSAADGGIVGVLVKAIDGDHTMAVVNAASGHDTFAEIDADDLLNLMAVIPQYAKAGAAWYCSPTAKSLVIDAIKLSGGGTTSQMLAERMTDSFLGYPIYITPVMADSASTTYNDLPMIAFGNLRQAAMMGSRREIRVALSEHRYFELDQIGVRGTERFDINVHSLGSTTVKSPFAVLTGNT